MRENVSENMSENVSVPLTESVSVSEGAMKNLKITKKLTEVDNNSAATLAQKENMSGPLAPLPTTSTGYKKHPLDLDEPFLNETDNKYVIFPIKYDDVWGFYKRAVSSFWTVEEVDLSKDMEDWIKLSDNEKHFIVNVLAFFAASDGIVNENLAVRFMNEVDAPEVKSFYGFQIAMENIHCVAAKTEVLTEKGYQCIDYLAKRDPIVKIWNGEQFSEVKVVQTSEASELMKVTLSNGMFLDCTLEHKWLIKDYPEPVFTKDLKEGMEILPFAYPNNCAQSYMDGEMFCKPYEHGRECALFDNKAEYDLMKYNMRAKYQLPMNYSLDTKVKWLSGFLSANTELNLEDENATLKIKSDAREFMQAVQLFLTCLDVRANLMIDDSVKPAMVYLTLDTINTCKLAGLGVTVSDKAHIQIILTQKAKESDYLFKTKIAPITITKIEKLIGRHPTYCFNEPLLNTGIFNGIRTCQSEMYSLLIEAYVKDAMEKSRLLNAVEYVPCVRKKAEWALRWISNDDARFATRLIAFACVEGIFFSGSFCAIFWLKERGVMPGLCLSNEFISRDEGLHTEFACLLYVQYVKHKLPEEDVHKIVQEAVEIENEFINDSIPCHMLGMNADLMNQYIKFVADRLLFQLGYEKIWNVKNPFDFMDRICLENKSNFFEHTRISEYARTNVGGNTNNVNAFEFSTNEDF